jgi:hypothetical protein
MLNRSLGADSFAKFWRYWNPIWGYYLARYVMKPLRKFLPVWLATMLTFTVSGVLHDLVVTLIKWQPSFLITPWFVLMGGAVVVTKAFAIEYSKSVWAARALINGGLIVICCFMAYFMRHAIL